MRLIYGTATSVVVTLTNRYYGSIYRLYFADDFNAVRNPQSSNPLQIFLECRDMVKNNDITNPKYIVHLNGVRRATRRRLTGIPLKEALATIRRMGIHAMQPYLAILEVDTYEQNHAAPVQPLPPALAGSPTSNEYRVVDVRGPSFSNPELHLQPLH